MGLLCVCFVLGELKQRGQVFIRRQDIAPPSFRTEPAQRDRICCGALDKGLNCTPSGQFTQRLSTRVLYNGSASIPGAHLM